MASERCACGHDLHEPGQCGDKRLTFDCGCSYSPDTQPAPREAGATLTREEYRQRLRDAQLVGSEYDRCSDGAQENLLAHDAALRAENERVRKEWETAHAANDDLVNRHITNINLISALRAEVERLTRERDEIQERLDACEGENDTLEAHADAAEAERDRLAEALREIEKESREGDCACVNIAAATLKREEKP